jgi:hypothetical protein
VSSPESAENEPGSEQNAVELVENQRNISAGIAETVNAGTVGANKESKITQALEVQSHLLTIILNLLQEDKLERQRDRNEDKLENERIRKENEGNGQNLGKTTRGETKELEGSRSWNGGEMETQINGKMKGSERRMSRNGKG